MNLFTAIYNRWNVVGWIPPLNTLQHHATHMCGGGMVVLIFIAFGTEWYDAALWSSSIFALVEFVTGFIRNNWPDSIFDFVQYLFHWPFYFAHVGQWWVFGISFAVLLVVYFSLLLKDKT